MRKLWCPYSHSEGESLQEGARLGTAGLRPQARAQGGVAPLLRNAYSQSCNMGRAADNDGRQKVCVHDIGKL